MNATPQTINGYLIQTELDLGIPTISGADVVSPRGYTGLSAFHKYWGKKPIECLGFLIDTLTNAGDIVLDPFVGSGLIARETAIRQRRFIGVDINPVSIELSRLICDLPSQRDLQNSLSDLEDRAKPPILESYALADNRFATHYLWDGAALRQVWVAGNRGKKREALAPTPHDIAFSERYAEYESKHIRSLRLFTNARINTSPSLTLRDLFTGRALRNMDILVELIHAQAPHIRRALLLCLTGSSGQMSQMVFAITGRGKVNGNSSDKVEVGSWVIGYWRPPLHFEVNVWNCFENRAKKLLKSIENASPHLRFPTSEAAEDVLSHAAQIALLRNDSASVLQRFPNDTVALVVTDPPHSDRIPYLELSEMWNAILGYETPFPEEIVVSNARERGKDKPTYQRQMMTVLIQVFRVLVPGGVLAIFFNARDHGSWSFLELARQQIPFMEYVGCFPMAYSANSVVQDNREGSMKSDYVLIYRKGGGKDIGESPIRRLLGIPGWSEDFPQAKG